MQEVKVCSEVGLLENGELIGQSQKKKKKKKPKYLYRNQFYFNPFFFEQLCRINMCRIDKRIPFCNWLQIAVTDYMFLRMSAKPLWYKMNF